MNEKKDKKPPRVRHVAVKVGLDPVEHAEKLMDYFRVRGDSDPLSVKQVADQMRLAVDRVMGEGSLYAPALAALALKQAEGDTVEAACLLRAYRSTQPRWGYSLPISTRDMVIVSRVTSAFKDIPGGQFLGSSKDYSQKLLRFGLREESQDEIQALLRECTNGELLEQVPESFPRLIDLLRERGLLEDDAGAKGVVEEPFDITLQGLVYPAPRSAQLQALARGETGGMLALAYTTMSSSVSHPILAEVRVGYCPMRVTHPYLKEPVTIGEVLVTECDMLDTFVSSATQPGAPKLRLGYGLCFGQNEIKAIAMSVLDLMLRSRGSAHPASQQEFVLRNIEGTESAGFIQHLKLPHY
ncbi:MAG: carbon-phosphorus lyase complex subunit PhnI [Deltaproteobacteria bacterium]|nr:carbon-phosphorus lyase complex subunit PhnI [Deltaproteobacteria bacterium]